MLLPPDTNTGSPQVSLVALGPLTNLALAVRLDPCFPKKLKDLYIMGGNMEGNIPQHDYRLYLKHVICITLSFLLQEKEMCRYVQSLTLQWIQSLPTLCWKNTSAPHTSHRGSILAEMR